MKNEHEHEQSVKFYYADFHLIMIKHVSFFTTLVADHSIEKTDRLAIERQSSGNRTAVNRMQKSRPMWSVDRLAIRRQGSER